MNAPSTADDWLARADGTHALRWSGVGGGGHWRQEITREPDHRYRSTYECDNDFDPMGGAWPEVRTNVLDADAARAEIAKLLQYDGEPSVRPLRAT